MRFLIAVSFLALWGFSRSQDGPTYYDDDEPELPFQAPDLYPKNSLEFLVATQFPYDYTAYMPSEVGNLFAGRAEFPWLVHIRWGGDENEDYWAPGNLLTSLHVLTTCRYVRFLEWVEDTSDPPEAPIVDKEIRVMYASSYLWENHDDPLHHSSKRRDDKLPTFYTAGTRIVRLSLAHVQCDDDPVEYDVGLLQLTEDIFPVLPYINYMPVAFLDSQMKLVNFNMDLLSKKNCYVASFGRNWANWGKHMVVDFKVKHRAYLVPWEKCSQSFDRGYYNCTHPPSILHTVADPNTPCVGGIVQRSYSSARVAAGFAALKCFNTRAHIGTVCDHDTGAPLVCNGRVYGIVTRGASMGYCSSVYPIPFTVLKITAAADYFSSYLRAPFRFAPLPVDRPYMENQYTGFSFAPPYFKASIIHALFALSSFTLFL